MIKTLRNVLKQDKEKFAVPKKVQDIIPVRSIWSDGIFMTGKNKYSKMYRFTDINYAVASREDKEGMFLSYSELLNSLGLYSQDHHQQPKTQHARLRGQDTAEDDGR